MNNPYKYFAQWGVKVFPTKNHPALLLGDKPFVSLLVDLMPTKRAKKFAEKFNKDFKDQIDWDYEKK